jgi:hypothetical protein
MSLFDVLALQEVEVKSRFINESLNWRKLCRAAAVEQDPDKLSQIVRRIGLALNMRQRELTRFAKARPDHIPHISSRFSRAA